MSLAFAAACGGDLSGLEQRVDALDNRVSALESIVSALNENVEAIKALVEGATVYSVTQEDGVYTVKLSNGETYRLNQGTDGIGQAPQMSVDAQGYWMMDTGSGAGYVLDASGAKVKAAGVDGITPVFSVDSEGYWTIILGSGSPAQVLDQDGKPVKAVPSADVVSSYFADVALQDDILVLTLRNGTQYKVPVVSDFLCEFTDDTQVVYSFKEEETKQFGVKMIGVSSYLLLAPDAWTASIADDVMTLRCPKLTKAASASNYGEVSIVARSAQGYVAVAKLKVEVEGAVVLKKPTASLSVVDEQTESLTFAVTINNATDWYYILKKASGDAPAPESVVSDGTKGSGETLTLVDLDENTAYTLYVVPVNGEQLGSLSYVNASTKTSAEAVDYYQKWLDGETITIAGESFSKAADGEGILLEATEGAFLMQTYIHGDAGGGIYFLDNSEGSYFEIAPTGTNIQIRNRTVLIGRYSNKPADVRFGADSKYTQLRGDLLAMNIILDERPWQLTTKPAPMIYYTVASHYLCLDACIIYPYASLANTSAAGTCLPAENIRIVNSYIEMNSSMSSCRLLNFDKAAHLNAIKDFTFENNIVYSADAKPFTLMYYASSGTQTARQQTVVSIIGNTFYNASMEEGLFHSDDMASLKFRDNILYKVNTSGSTWLAKTVQDGTEVSCDVDHNLVYTPGEVVLFGTESSFIPSSGNVLSKIDEEPFASVNAAKRRFVPKSEYSSYGAQR